MNPVSKREFWEIAEPLLASGVAYQGRIMGSVCLRVRGEFLAMPNHKGPGIIVKLPRERVDELIAAGTGQPFAPAGRIFREWVLVQHYDPDLWERLLAEGRDFAGG